MQSKRRPVRALRRKSANSSLGNRDRSGPGERAACGCAPFPDHRHESGRSEDSEDERFIHARFRVRMQPRSLGVRLESHNIVAAIDVDDFARNGRTRVGGEKYSG